MRTLNEVSVGSLSFDDLNTAGDSSAELLSYDDGALYELVVSVTSGSTVATTKFNIEVNGILTESVFTMPITAVNTGVVLEATEEVRVSEGDRIKVSSDGGAGATTVATAELILRA